MALGITPRTRRYGLRDPDDPHQPDLAPPNPFGIVGREPATAYRQAEALVGTSSDDAQLLSTVVKPRLATSARAAPAEALQREYEELQAQPAVDKNGRVKSAILNALIQMGEQANATLRTGRPIDEYALASIAGKGIGGAAAGGFRPDLDEQYKRRRRMADLEGQIATQLELEKTQAETARLNAEAEYARQRPEIEADKARGTAANRDRQAFFRRLGIKKGMPLNDEDIKEGARLGIQIDPKQWLNTKDNIVTASITDPEDPTKTNLIRLNKATGEMWHQAQKGFQQPVNPETGMTPAQEAANADRDRNYELRKKRAEAEMRHTLFLENDARKRRGEARVRLKMSAAALKARAEYWQIPLEEYEKLLNEVNAEPDE